MKIFKEDDNLNMFVELLAPTAGSLTGDFDLMVEGVHKFNVQHNKIIENLKKKSNE